jgi:aldehyde:ferredoxin oxidoreductase
MLKGTAGKILRVDLAKNTIETEQIDEKFYRLYPGGKALAAYFLLKEFPKGTDPFSPDNILILANGVLTGAPFSTATRFTAAARSPLTLGFGESEAGGFWGPELKMAGWEAIILKGRAPHPVYLWIHNDHVEILDANELWGQEPEFVQNRIRERHGDRLIRVLQIGIAGENLVRFAAIENDLRHFNGRTGMGAVMGSKNLRAVAVRGNGKYLKWANDPRKIAGLVRSLANRVKDHPRTWNLQEKGTPSLVDSLNAAGLLPTRNFHQGAFDQVDKVNWMAYEHELLTGRRSCYACAIHCKREVALDDRYKVSSAYGGPEYETLNGFGPNCGVDDLQAIAKANELCNRYGLDTISCSSTISFAMECFEHGLIGLSETGGIDLSFGNASAMLTMIEQIAKRQGFGDLLAEGTRLAAESIGGDALSFSMQVKGQELPMHDPRGKVGVGLGYAVNEAGADNLTAIHDTSVADPDSLGYKAARPLGIEAVPAVELSERKARNYFILENWSSAGKALGICYFGPAPRSFIQLDELVSALQAATGWDVSIQEILEIGERATNLARTFNVRERFSRKDDTLPERLFLPIENGPLQGAAISKEGFERTMTALYMCKGWDPSTGAPTRARLSKLNIEWAADIIGVQD